MAETVLEPVDIVTERLRLRRFRRSDAPLIELYASDARVARMTERIPHPYPPGLAASFVERVARGAPDAVGWAVAAVGSAELDELLAPEADAAVAAAARADLDPGVIEELHGAAPRRRR